MSIVKKHLILHTFENIRAVHDINVTRGGREYKSWVINNVYPSVVPPNNGHPSVVPPNDVHVYARTFKMLVENTCNKGIVYVEWLVRKNDKLKRFNLFK